MNKEGVGFFANLFSTKGNVENPQTFTEVTATLAAQPHVLREKMKEQQMTHGETVTATLSPVRLESALGSVHVYFCPMESVQIIDKITPGDGGDLPLSVTVEGLSVPTGQRSGLYTLKNVKLSSNGTMQVIADEKTSWEVYD
jgi:hypothetical protein